MWYDMTPMCYHHGYALAITMRMHLELHVASHASLQLHVASRASLQMPVRVSYLQTCVCVCVCPVSRDAPTDAPTDPPCPTHTGPYPRACLVSQSYCMATMTVIRLIHKSPNIMEATSSGRYMAVCLMMYRHTHLKMYRHTHLKMYRHTHLKMYRHTHLKM